MKGFTWFFIWKNSLFYDFFSSVLLPLLQACRLEDPVYFPKAERLSYNWYAG